ncbi:hypothetical protein B566_EDAN013682 [Ephemera danica]|nr:hypothetical protein B566_EDAN013682 [Ephemera danica]
MESTQVKTEPEINIEEIKFDPLEDHLYCLPKDADGTLLQQNNKKEPQQSHQCKHCGISYTNLEMLDWHIEHCHGPDPKIKVLRTGRQFITKSSLMKHKCKKKTSQLEHNDLQLNDGQQPTVEISSPEVEDHTVKVEPEDDQMDLPEHQNNCE